MVTGQAPDALEWVHGMLVEETPPIRNVLAKTCYPLRPHRATRHARFSPHEERRTINHHAHLLVSGSSSCVCCAGWRLDKIPLTAAITCRTYPYSTETSRCSPEKSSGRTLSPTSSTRSSNLTAFKSGARKGRCRSGNWSALSTSSKHDGYPVDHAW